MATGPGGAAHDGWIPLLRDAFQHAEYTVDGVAGLLGAAAQTALEDGDRRPARRAAARGGPLGTLVRLFLLGEPVPAAPLASALGGPAVAGAVEAGVLRPDGSDLRARVDLRPYGEPADGWWVASDPTYRGGGPAPAPDHVPGIGGASLTLARWTAREPVGAALDVGTGCGVQALHLSAHADRVVGTDSNPRAAALARMTFALSGVPAETAVGDLVAPVRSARFDLAVANPPFVVSPSGGYLYRDGGLPADDFSRRVVRALPTVLTEGGTAQLLANWLHVRGEDWRERVASWLSGLGCDAWVVQREATDPAGYAEMWLRDSGEVALPDYEERYEEWSRSFDDRKVEAIGFGVISLRRTDAAHPAVRLEDLRHDIGGSLGPVGAIVAAELGQMATAQSLSPDEVLLSARLSAVPDVRLEQVAAPSAEGWEVATQTLVRTSGVGRRVVADGVLADLVAGCTGDAELGQVLAVLAAAYDVPTHELAAHALPAVHELLGYGFLRPAV